MLLFLSFLGGRLRDNYPKWILHERKDKRAALIPSSSTANTEQMNPQITVGHWIHSPNGSWRYSSWVRMTGKAASPLTCRCGCEQVRICFSCSSSLFESLLQSRGNKRTDDAKWEANLWQFGNTVKWMHLECRHLNQKWGGLSFFFLAPFIYWVS